MPGKRIRKLGSTYIQLEETVQILNITIGYIFPTYFFLHQFLFFHLLNRRILGTELPHHQIPLRLGNLSQTQTKNIYPNYTIEPMPKSSS